MPYSSPERSLLLQAAGEHATAGASSGPRRRRVLVVDDNRDAADTLALLLELLGHEVATAHDGEQALVRGAEFGPEVVLLDIGLPGISGYEVCRRLRDAPWGARAYVVALTGWGQAEDERRAGEAGFDRHLVKPVDEPVLLQLLDDAP